MAKFDSSARISTQSTTVKHRLLALYKSIHLQKKFMHFKTWTHQDSSIFIDTSLASWSLMRTNTYLSVMDTKYLKIPKDPLRMLSLSQKSEQVWAMELAAGLITVSTALYFQLHLWMNARNSFKEWYSDNNKRILTQGLQRWSWSATDKLLKVIFTIIYCKPLASLDSLTSLNSSDSSDTSILSSSNYHRNSESTNSLLGMATKHISP